MLQDSKQFEIILLNLLKASSDISYSFDDQVKRQKLAKKGGLGHIPELAGYDTKHEGQKIIISEKDFDNEYEAESIQIILDKFQAEKILYYKGPINFAYETKYKKPIFEVTLPKDFSDICDKKITQLQSEIGNGQPYSKRGIFTPIKQIKIKKITLRPEDLILEINDGDKIITFRNRKGKEENKETKFFKIIYHLWDFREEIGKNGKMTKKGEWITLENLTKGAKSTKGATTKNVSRLRDMFKKEGVAIEIKSSNNGRYKLIIKFG